MSDTAAPTLFDGLILTLEDITDNVRSFVTVAMATVMFHDISFHSFSGCSIRRDEECSSTNE